jgi:hypothetical protein
MSLFRFAQTKDFILMIVGIFCATGVGASYPVFAYLWGNLIDSFINVDITSFDL